MVAGPVGAVIGGATAQGTVQTTTTSSETLSALKITIRVNSIETPLFELDVCEPSMIGTVVPNDVSARVANLVARIQNGIERERSVATPHPEAAGPIQIVGDDLKTAPGKGWWQRTFGSE